VLHGRDVEIAAVGALLDAARAGDGGALVVRGAPGVGKTALLEEARTRAADMQLLGARGVEAESDLPFAGLHQLLRPAWPVVEALPGPHRTALHSAFGFVAGTGQERFLVFSACLTVLSELADARPVLGVVDDAHWLDTASAEALQFVARRLERDRVALLFAARDQDVRRFDGGDLPSMTLQTLDPDAASVLLRRTTESAAATVTERILAQARGNPLALIELPRALTDAQLTGAAPLPDQLPLTDQLEAAFNERVGRLPDDTRHLLLLAAADDCEDVRLVARASMVLGIDPRALDAAEQAGLVTVAGNHLEFRHPLVRSAIYGAATSSHRRAAHRAIADALVGDDQRADQRAWHLATATVTPDDTIVAQLDDVAARAQARGGHVAAARALERAAELSTEPNERAARYAQAAHNLGLAGRDEQALALVAGLDHRALTPRHRADVAVVRASAAIRFHGRPLDCVPELIAAARDIAPSHPSQALRLIPLATFAAWQGWDQAAQLDIARVAATIDLDRLNEAARHLAASVAGFAAMIEGDRTTADQLLGDTVAWAYTVDNPSQVVWASWAALWLGDEDTFDGLLRRAAGLARAQGQIGPLTEALGMQAVQLSLLAQRYDESSIAAYEAIRLADDLHADSLTLFPRSALAIIAAVRGDDDQARRIGEDVVRLARAKGHLFRASPAVYALALLDIAASRWNEALDRLAQLTDTNDPALAIVAPEIVEAAMRAGRPDQTRTAFALYEARVERSDTAALRPRMASCRALLATGAEATCRFATAIELIDHARPFDRPRILLLFGEHLRRLGRRLDAREHLRAAIDGFEDIGADRWAERARNELRATGETARRRTPAATTQLTPQELQIARLVAQGLTNKEVAAQLYLSPRTIDAHLRAVFSKLGITTRRDLRTVIPTGP
jgi:DNA-binding CsgD family transcriptional regulator